MLLSLTGHEGSQEAVFMPLLKDHSIVAPKFPCWWPKVGVSVMLFSNLRGESIVSAVFLRKE